MKNRKSFLTIILVGVLAFILQSFLVPTQPDGSFELRLDAELPTDETALHTLGSPHAIGAALWYGNYRGGEKAYLFGPQTYSRYDKANSKSEGPFKMSEWKLPQSSWTLDAALYYGNYRGSEMTYLFKGTSYYSYNKTKDELKGPFSLATNWKLPASWNRLDAAVYYGKYRGSEMVYLFKGKQYYSYNKNTDEAKGPFDLHQNWKVPSRWQKVDAAVYYGNYRGGESIYLFSGNEYGRYNKSTDKFEGPFPIRSNWFN